MWQFKYNQNRKIYAPSVKTKNNTEQKSFEEISAKMELKTRDLHYKSGHDGEAGKAILAKVYHLI